MPLAEAASVTGLTLLGDRLAHFSLPVDNRARAGLLQLHPNTLIGSGPATTG
jgi:hypothetical protein